jgi:hypothetical protein
MSDRKTLTRRARRWYALLPVALFAALAGVPAYAVTSLVVHQSAYYQADGGDTTQVDPDGIKNQN